jgi:hypothetical protein
MPEWNFHVVDHESDNFLAAHCRQHYPVDFCANLRVGRDNGGVTKDSLIGNVEPHHVYEYSGDLSPDISAVLGDTKGAAERRPSSE